MINLSEIQLTAEDAAIKAREEEEEEEEDSEHSDCL